MRLVRDTQSPSVRCSPFLNRLSFAFPKRPRRAAFIPSPLSGNQRGAVSGPQGGLPTDVSELRGGVHLRLYTRRRRNQRKLGRFHGLLGTSEQPETSHWGRRQLAYSIGTRENGYYVVSKFTADPTVLPEYERALKLDDGVIRYLITLHEHEVGAPAMSEEELAAQAARRDDDDDDED